MYEIETLLYLQCLAEIGIREEYEYKNEQAYGTSIKEDRRGEKD